MRYNWLQPQLGRCHLWTGAVAGAVATREAAGGCMLPRCDGARGSEIPGVRRPGCALAVFATPGSDFVAEILIERNGEVSMSERDVIFGMGNTIGSFSFHLESSNYVHVLVKNNANIWLASSKFTSLKAKPDWITVC